MAVSRQPETITSETSNREGLHEDHQPRGEARWKRFHPFKVVRKIFCRRVKRQGTEEVQESSKKSWSTSELQNIPDEENRYQDHSPPYKVGLSVSHDSIFSHDHSTISMDPDELQEMQASSISIHRTEIRDFQDELFRARRDSDDDDAGLPHSPCASPTTADILAQGLKKTEKSLNTCSAGSLASMESSENDEDSAGQLSSGHSSRASLLDRSAGTDSDIDSNQPVTLSHKAALHRIAVRPKRTHALPNRRRPKQISTPVTSNLPVTPEVSEEGKHSPLSSVKPQRKAECVTKTSNVVRETYHAEKLSHFRVKVASTQHTTNLKQQNRKTFSSAMESKPVDSGVQLIRSRSAAAELRSYQENRQRNSPLLEKRQEKHIKDVKSHVHQNKGVTVTVNKTETIFSPDGSVTTVQQRTTESGHSVLKETQLECYGDSEVVPSINEKRKSKAELPVIENDMRKEGIEPTEQAKSISITTTAKDSVGGVSIKPTGTKSEPSSNDSNYVETNEKSYEVHPSVPKEIPFICSNVKTVLSTLENLTDDNKQALCNSTEIQNPQSIAVVTVTQSETSHLIRETTIGENIKLSVMGAYGKTVIHTGGDIWSVSNVTRRDTNEELKKSNIEKTKVHHASEEYKNEEKLEIKTETELKTTHRSFYESPLESFAVDNQKTPTPQKRFSVEIVPFNQRIKDPNYLYSSGKENRFKTVDKNVNDTSALALKSENKIVDTMDAKVKDHQIYKVQDTTTESKKPIYPVHIKIHKGQSIEDKSGTTIVQSEPLSSHLVKDNTSKEKDNSGAVTNQSEPLNSHLVKDNTSKETTHISQEITPEFMKIQLNSAKSKDEKSTSSTDENSASYILDKLQAVKHGALDSNTLENAAGQNLLLNTVKDSTKSCSVNSNTTPTTFSNMQALKQYNETEDSTMEVNVKESAQIWEKMTAGESALDTKNKPVSRSSSTTSEEEPELLRVFARRSIKQKTDDKEATIKENESAIGNDSSATKFAEELSDSTGSNIISMSNNSTIIKISETTGTRPVVDIKTTVTKFQYVNGQISEPETHLPFVQKSHRSDSETKLFNSKLAMLENIDSNESTVLIEAKTPENILSAEKEQELPEDKMISIKRVSSNESQKSIGETKKNSPTVSNVCASKPISGAKAEMLDRTDSGESKQGPLHKLSSDSALKLPLKPILHTVTVDAKTVADVDAKAGSMPSSEQERGIDIFVTKPPLAAKTALVQDFVQKVSKPTLSEKPKLIEKQLISSHSPTKQHSVTSAETTPSRLHGNKLRSHTVSEVSQADIQKAQLRQRKASAPDISTCRNAEISAKEISSYCTPPVQGSKPELPPKSPSVTALAATRNSALSLSVDSAKVQDTSHESSKTKEANLPSWLQLAQQRREQREQRERLLMGPAAASFVLETSGKPTRNSKVWDMVHNFQKLQMT